MLIVDDSKPFRQIFREALLERFPSLKIEEAGDFSEGLKKFNALSPSLIILDISLPDGNGLELAGRIRRASPQAVVALCTMNDLPEYRQAAEKLGVSHFLVKDHLDWEQIGNLVSADLLNDHERREPVQEGLEGSYHFNTNKQSLSRGDSMTRSIRID